MNMYKTTVVLALCCIVTYVLSAKCPEYDPFVTPRWPKNRDLVFSVDDVSQESLLVTLSNVGKYVGSLQYVRIAGLNMDSASIVSNADFDSGSNATDNGDVFQYSNYNNMFSNPRYSSSENNDCTVNYQIQFQIKDILNSANTFNVDTSQNNLVIAEIPFYTGYAVKSRQSGHVWQYHEDLFIARIIINTLVRADGTKDVLNAACSSTVSQNSKGVIICTYSSTSPLELSQFNITVTDNNQMVLYPYYFESTSGNAKVKFQTVDDITGLVEFNAQVDASICIRGANGQCTTTPYLSPENPFSFQTGAGDITIEQEAELLFSTTITRFDAETDAATIIGATPEFFVLVRTKTPKSAWRVQSGSDTVNVRLSSVPKYNLPSYPDFPVGNTLTTYTSTNFPAETDANVVNNPNICYIVRFDNSNERYSRASETPIIIAVQFNIEQNARRRISQVSAPSGLAITKTIKSGCSGTECELRDLVANSNSGVSDRSVNWTLSVVILVLCLIVL